MQFLEYKWKSEGKVNEKAGKKIIGHHPEATIEPVSQKLKTPRM